MSNPFVKYLFTAVSGSAIFCLDQATKIFIQAEFQSQEPYVVIPGFFNIVYVTNPGGIFGLFAGSHEIIRFILFLLFPLICVLLLFMMLKDTQNRFQVLALSFILGGAAGNYIDRIRLGFVIDFIDWHVGDLHWPSFNIADSFIVIGVCILFFFYFQEWRDSKKT